MAKDRHWDYRTPYFYLVTLHRRSDSDAVFSELDAAAPFGVRVLPQTQAISAALLQAVRDLRGLDSITPYAILPDRIHLLVRIGEDPERYPLGTYVRILKSRLREAVNGPGSPSPPLFGKGWDECIVRYERQLPRTVHFVRTAAASALWGLRHPDRFRIPLRTRHWSTGDRRISVLGESLLLSAPLLRAVVLPEALRPGTADGERVLRRYDYWPEGGVAVGTWQTAAEKEAYGRILARGGRIIRLCPEGIGPACRPWGPASHVAYEAGRLLCLAVHEPGPEALSDAEFRVRTDRLNALAEAMAAAVPPM